MVQVLPDIMEEERFMTCTGASQQRAVDITRTIKENINSIRQLSHATKEYRQ